MLAAHRKAHRAIWRTLALLIPLVLLAGWFARPHARIDVPERLSTPHESPR